MAACQLSLVSNRAGRKMATTNAIREIECFCVKISRHTNGCVTGKLLKSHGVKQMTTKQINKILFVIFL
ncbi:unnamed protein product [Onchocerca flexuosa]|uniref:HTH_48 domain-containing protein n=1 Tax=Onchocerca flexuosa TaxID=387005 RepID=A0A183HYY8_9BILA|nr:unnamed protein product [Onchocerca flexuosa]